MNAGICNPPGSKIEIKLKRAWKTQGVIGEWIRILTRCRLMNWNATVGKVYGDLLAYYWSLFWWLRAWSRWKWTMFLHLIRIVFWLLVWQRSLRSLATWCLWWQPIVSCEIIRIGSRNQVFERKFLADVLACQETLRPWSEFLGNWSRICLAIQTTSPADKFTRSNWYDSNGSWLWKESKKSTKF